MFLTLHFNFLFYGFGIFAYFNCILVFRIDMFVVIAEISIKHGLEFDFKEWFSESNKVFSKVDGFISRRLLKYSNGTYCIIVEHQSKDTFEQMHNSKKHSKLHATAVTFMDLPPTPKFYNVLAN